MQYSIVNFVRASILPTFRLDPEYYLPNYLRIEKIITEKQSKFVTLKKLNLKLDASAFYPSLEPYYGLGKMPFIRVTDVDTKIDFDNCIKIPTDIFNKYKTLKRGKKGDIIITKGGTVARIGLLEKDSALSRDLIFVNTSKLTEKDYVFIYYYFLTSFYKKLLIRSSSMTAQPHLTLTLVKDIPLYIPSESFKEMIYHIHCQSTRYYQNSKELYKQAKTLLLSKLGFLGWKPKHQLSFVRNFSDTQKAERMDAEYFQTKYDELAKAIKSYSSGWDTVGNILNVKDKNFSPKEGIVYKYIELANIGGNGEVAGCTKAEGQELPTRARRKVTAGDVIVSSIEGSLSSISLITEEYNGALCSTGFYIIDSNDINSETLLVLLKSTVGQLQLKKGCSGTILTAINKDEFGKIILPKIDDSLQNQIKQKITESFNLRKQSKHLLESAKRAVEIAIEEDEAEGQKYINEQLQK